MARQVSMRGPVLWGYALTAGQVLVTAVVTLVLAAILTPTDYGAMALAALWVAFAQLLVTHFAAALIQRPELAKSHLDAAFWISLLVAAGLAGALAALAPAWAALNRLALLAPLCWALAPAIVGHALTVVPDALLRRQIQLRQLSVRILTASLLAGVSGLVAAVAGLGVWALVTQQLVFTGVNVVLVWWLVVLRRRDWRPGLSGVVAAGRDLRRYWLHSASGFLAYFVAVRGDTLLLGGVFGAATIGLYRFASRLVELVVEFAGGGLRQVSLPDMSRYAEDPHGLGERMRRLLHASAIATLPVLGVLFAISELLLGLLGPQWLPAAAAGRPGVAAAIGWAEAAASLAGVALVGHLLRGDRPAAQAAAIATTYVLVYAVFLGITYAVVLRRIVRIPAWPPIRAMLPAAVAALAGGGAGTAVAAIANVPATIIGLIGVTTLAATVTAVTLFSLDGWARTLLRSLRPVWHVRLPLPRQPDRIGVKERSR